MLTEAAKRILVVDDEEFCISSMKAMLQKAGLDIYHQVDFCINGEEALKLLIKQYTQGKSYKMIFTDFEMPVMDGIKMTSEIRTFLTHQMDLQRDQQPRIFGLTGHCTNSFTIKGLQSGMDLVLSKPIYYIKLEKLLYQHKIIAKPK